MSRYDLAVLPGTTYERAATMVERHARGGLVVDLGCSFGRVAEVIAAGGRGYVGVDVDPEGLASLAERGHESHRLDLAADDLAATLAAIVGDRPVSAVLALDVIEHLPDPGPFLDQLGELCGTWGEPLVITSIPNVAHRDLAAKLLAGRWDLTDTGLLDRTHLSLFTEERMNAELARRGLVAVDADDVVGDAHDQHFPPHHPFLAGGTPLGELLRWLRSLPDDTAQTYQFVRAFRRRHHHPAAAPPPVVVSEPVELTAVVVGGGDGRSLAGLEDSLVCLAAQERETFDVVVAVHPDVAERAATVIGRFAPGFRAQARVVATDAPTVGGRLNRAVLDVAAPLLAFVVAGDVLTPEWSSLLIQAAGHHPGALVRVRSYQRTVIRDDAATLSSTNAAPITDDRFDLWTHLSADQLPLGSFAMPTALVSQAGLRFAEESAAAEWGFTFVAAMLAGVADVAAIACVHQRTERDAVPVASDLTEILARTPVFVPAGWFPRLQGDRNHLAYLTHELAAMTERAEEAEARLARMSASRAWRVTAPLRGGARWVRRA